MNEGPLAMPKPSSKPISPLIEREEREVERGNDHGHGRAYVEKTNSSSNGSIGSLSMKTLQSMAFEDGMTFLSFAAQALSRDEFSGCFEPKPTAQPTDHLMYVFYIFGAFIRYGILFPIRLMTFLVASLIFISLFPICFVYKDANLMRFLFRTYCKAWLFSFSAVIKHHGRKPRPDESHLFVVNHTSFIDYLLMSSHCFPHATVAQVHGGLFGWLQRHVLSLNGSLFFNRSEQKDRLAVSRRMQAHIDARPQVSPLLIFPEGTCVNNESTVLFHKGAFELDGLICPVAIKYNKRLLDPYWNTREQTFTQHALYLMTRWFMVTDVWWLSPQRRQADETAIQFANRVKALISETAGLRNLSWDGYMKNCMQHKDQEKMRKNFQEKYVSALRRRLTPGGSVQTSTSTSTSSPQSLSSPSVEEEEEEEREEGEETTVKISKIHHVTAFPTPIRRRAFSLISQNSGNATLSTATMVPNATGNNARQKQLYLPNWLSEKAIVDIKNELMLAESQPRDGSLKLINHMRDRKESVIETWRFYSRANRKSPISLPLSDSHVTERRLENSSWRLWFRQRQEEDRLNVSSPSELSTEFVDGLFDMELGENDGQQINTTIATTASLSKSLESLNSSRLMNLSREKIVSPSPSQ